MSETDREIAAIHRHIDENFDAYVERLKRYIRQKSVSSQDMGVKEWADMVLGFVEDLGAEAELVKYDLPYAQPIVYGKLKSKRGRKTLINYHMYDTMPVPDPDEWVCPPWEAKIVDLPPFGESIVARGAINSKGPSMAFINALEAIEAVTGDVPVNLFLIFDGEEEINSPSLEPFVKEHLEELKKADAEYMHGARQDAKGVPRLTLGCKGEMDLEFEVVVRPEDTHSGSKPILDSAVWRLIWAFNSLCDSSDEIAIEGWRDEIRPPTEEELGLLRKLAETLDEEAFKESIGRTPRFRKGMHGLEMLKAYTYEPTLNISGVAAGYVGPRFLNIVPARAEARADVRLVPEMGFESTLEKIRRHLDVHGFEDIRVTCTAGYTWSKTPLSSDVVQAVIRTYRRWGCEPRIWPIAGGTGPYYLWTQLLGIPAAGGGMGHGGKAHAPNEYIVLEGYRDCMKSAVTFLYEYAKI